jgi:hypothetical protein
MVVREPGLMSRISNWVLGDPHFIISTNAAEDFEVLKSTFYTQWMESEQVSQFRSPDCIRILYHSVLRKKLDDLPSQHYSWSDFEKALNDQQASCYSLLNSTFFTGCDLIAVLTTLKDYKKLTTTQKKEKFEALKYKIQRLQPSTLQREVFPYLLTPEMFAETAAISLYADIFAGRIIDLSNETNMTTMEAYLQELHKVKQFSVRYHLLLLSRHYGDILKSMESMSEIFAEVSSVGLT